MARGAARGGSCLSRFELDRLPGGLACFVAVQVGGGAQQPDARQREVKSGPARQRLHLTHTRGALSSRRAALVLARNAERRVVTLDAQRRIGAATHVFERLPAQAIALARDADLLIHDAMHADHDYDLRRGWGHSPARAGVAVAEKSGAKCLALFHHSPDATDTMIDEVVLRTSQRTAVRVFAAAEGSYLDV